MDVSIHSAFSEITSIFFCSSFSINHIFVILSMDLMTVRLLTSKNFAIVSRDIVHRGMSGFFDR